MSARDGDRWKVVDALKLRRRGEGRCRLMQSRRTSMLLALPRFCDSKKVKQGFEGSVEALGEVCGQKWSHVSVS